MEESFVEIEASFSNSVAAFDVAFICKNCKKKITHEDGLFDWNNDPDSGTLKRNAPLPALELSQSDLVRLLSYLEGELQARDIVIASMKSEKAKQFLYQAKYGHLNLNDPLAALQRDSDLCEDGFDETSVGKLYESQLGYLERLISVQRRTHYRAKEILSFVENQHARLVRDLEQERRWPEDDEERNGIYAVLSHEQERLNDELEFEKTKQQQIRTELAQLQTTLFKERERHKAIVVYLQDEYKQLLAQFYDDASQRASIQKEVNANNASINNAESVRQDELRLLRQQLEQEKQQVLNLMRLVKRQETELNAMRRLASTSAGQLLMRNRISSGFLDASTHHDTPATETTSIGVALNHPQQLLHASGILKRSSSAVTSPARTNRGILTTARSYVSNAKNAMVKRHAASVSPPLRRWGHVVELYNGNSTALSSNCGLLIENLAAEEDSELFADHEIKRSIVRLEPDKNERASRTPKKRVEEIEPEIAELEAVLKSLAFATDIALGSGSSYVHFPDVEEPPPVTAEKKTDAIKVDGLDVLNGRLEVNGKSLERKNVVPNGKQLADLSTPPIVKKHASKSKQKPESDGKTRPPRIPISKTRRQSESAVASSTVQSPAPPDLLNHRSASETTAVESKKSSVPGCSSPHLALQRKVKAIGNLANRIQRRVVAGMVNQVAVRQRSDSTSNKEQPKAL